MSKITFFSSSEANAYVEMLHFHLSQDLENRHLLHHCNTWRNNVIFGNGTDTISALIDYAKELKTNDGYAVFFFAPDDLVTIRGNEYYTARDNVWLEYGLFSAILGPAHVFPIFPKNPVTKNGKKRDWHCPTDFTTQRTNYTYDDDPRAADDSMKEACTRIADIVFSQSSNMEIISSNKNRYKADAEIEKSHRFNPKG